MTDEQKKKWYRRVALVGALLGLACSLLPPEYRAVCQAVANICTGGL